MNQNAPNPENDPAHAWEGRQIEHRALASLMPYASNARTHSDEQIDQIIASINEWGWTNPVLIDEEGMILAGHGRAMAALKMGLVNLPCIVIDGLTNAQKRAYVIADNKLALNAGWDETALRDELMALADLNFDVSLTGFDDAALDVRPLAEMPVLPEGDRAPFQQMTFTLHDSQVARLKVALNHAKEAGPFTASPNENSNGNALDRIVTAYIAAHDKR